MRRITAAAFESDVNVAFRKCIAIRFRSSRTLTRRPLTRSGAMAPVSIAIRLRATALLLPRRPNRRGFVLLDLQSAEADVFGRGPQPVEITGPPLGLDDTGGQHERQANERDKVTAGQADKFVERVDVGFEGVGGQASSERDVDRECRLQHEPRVTPRRVFHVRDDDGQATAGKVDLGQIFPLGRKLDAKIGGV